MHKTKIFFTKKLKCSYSHVIGKCTLVYRTLKTSANVIDNFDESRITLVITSYNNATI